MSKSKKQLFIFKLQLFEIKTHLTNNKIIASS